MITIGQMHAFAPHGIPWIMQAIADTSAVDLLKGQITTQLRLQHFMAVIYEETGGFTEIEENLNYSAARAHVVWPHRFLTVASALPYAHNPHLLANLVYGGRMGNNFPNDGWLYRGQGLIQSTGKGTYIRLGKALGLDLVATPAMLTSREHMLECAAVNYMLCGALAAADRDDLTTETERVNGGLTNMPARIEALKRAKAIF